jgi:hypothetical protein
MKTLFQKLVDDGWEPDLASSVMDNKNNTFDYDDLERLFSVLTILKEIHGTNRSDNRDNQTLEGIIKELEKVL